MDDNNAQAGPGPSTSRIRFIVPSSRPPPSDPVPSAQEALDVGVGEARSVATSTDGCPTAPPASDINDAAFIEHQSGWTSRPPDASNTQPSSRGQQRQRRSRGRGGSRSRGLSGRGARHNPPRHSSVRASTRISEQIDIEPGNARRVTLSFNRNGANRHGGEVGRKTSFLGEYDRDLDENPQEPLAFEEQFILRVPDSIAGSLREVVKGKGKGMEGVEIKFLDTRRAAFRFDGKTYSSKLVDLPNIIESQKTLDSRHLFKVADISQMLVVGDRVDGESSINASALDIDEYIWPHGITPPLRHVRKRRFRKRLSRRAIEVVEEQVEELLGKDENAESSHTDLIDVNPGVDVPDSYYINFDPDAIWFQNDEAEGSELDGSEFYDDPGSIAPRSDMDENEYYDNQSGAYTGDEDDEEGYDNDLAAALREELADDSDQESASDDDDGSGDDEDEEGIRSGDEEEDEELAEKKAKIKQYSSEIKILETTIEKKKNGFTGGNPIMVKRFEETIGGLQADINTKVSARQALTAEVAALAAVKAPKPIPVEAAATPLKASPTSDLPHGDEEEDDDGEDADSYEESPARPPELSDQGDEDDLFGDGDDDDDGEYEEVDAVATPFGIASDQQSQTLDDKEIDDLGPEIDDEMAALLEAELDNDMDAEFAESTFSRAMEDMEVNPFGAMGESNIDLNSTEMAFQTDFGVEGGVGMRRLATGVVDEGDASDSEESD